MKLKSFYPILAICLTLMLVSWGYTGHRTIGFLTENHLTPNAKLAIKDLLGDTSISEACTWADDARREPQYANTANWHFLNLPLGLNYEDFQKYIDTLKSENVYSELINQEKILTNNNSTKQQKINALKFMMHFVGDLHQPMHISREEDKGGSTIQVNYNGKGTNLHSLWDTRMLEKEGLSAALLAIKFDTISETDIKQWQKDPVMVWMWESYQISTVLYAEIAQMNNKTIDDTYYQKHMPIVQKRMQQAAIRLAGILNKIYR
ncbi:S1/P1 nuclease [Pedobacter sp. Du54]|uniref:S1/P1 nuclease n=1 Tax=Pedobacter anseongensis TaxID=3133439 RepID=UPI0030964AD6